MADGQTPAYRFRSAFPWTEIFRCFQVALDPRKLFVAALGILAMSIGWYLLSTVFVAKKPDRDADVYSNKTMDANWGDEKPRPQDRGEYEAALTAEGDRKHKDDVAQWVQLNDLAGEGGRLRTLPWYEYRGPNPFLAVTGLIGGSSVERTKLISDFASGSVPVLVEPLVKLLLPVSKLISPGVSTLTRFYLLLVIIWSLMVWAFCAGVITRIAAVQLAGKGPITFRQAVRFVAKRYVSYVLTPLVPLVIIAAVVIGLVCYGILGLIPFVGDLLVLGLGLPVVVGGGAVMAVFLVGLVGYPLMYTTLSAEGDASDTFEALSRSINYVYQAPWHYAWYFFVAVVYGAIVTFFVLFFSSLAVYMGKWAVGLTASAVYTDRKPDYMFIYTPESFGWKELFLKDSPYAVKEVKDEPKEAGQRALMRYELVDQGAHDRAKGEFWAYNRWGAGLVSIWMTLIFLMMLGFSYSFFWTASTMIFFLMRKKADDFELDEVFLEDETPEVPPAPPKIAEGTAGAPTSLPMIPPVPPAPPVVVPPPPPIPLAEVPPVPPPPEPPATIPFPPPPPPALFEPPPDAPPKDEPKP